MYIFWLVIIGLISGVCAGMGMGGGTILIPALTIFMGIKQKFAQGINLFAFIPTSIVALIIHIKNKLVNFKIGVPIMIGGVIISVFASLLAINIKSNVLKILFGCFLICVGVFELVCSVYIYVKNKNKKKGRNKIKFSVKPLY